MSRNKVDKKKGNNKRTEGCFFFFEQKTAYEIEYGLVGSELCIRGSLGTKRRQRQGRGPTEDFTDTPEGLADWCAQLDARALERETRSPLAAADFVARFGHVSCHAAWPPLIHT